MTHVIKNEFYTLTVDEFGAQMTSLISNGKELLWNTKIEGCWSEHAPLLFPVCGRIKDGEYVYGSKVYKMPQHGFAKRTSFTVKSKTESCIELELTSDDATREIYPFDFIFSAKYELSGKEIKFTATVENTDDKVMPYMFGWHPGFNLPTDCGQDIEDYILNFGKLDSCVWIPLQHVAFASPKRINYPLNNGCYRLCEKEIYDNDTLIFEEHFNKVSLYAEGHPFKLDMQWSANLPSLCIWKQPNSAAKFLCIEPWSGTPNNGEDAENFETRKMARLNPGQKEDFIYTMSFTL